MEVLHVLRGNKNTFVIIGKELEVRILVYGEKQDRELKLQQEVKEVRLHTPATKEKKIKEKKHHVKSSAVALPYFYLSAERNYMYIRAAANIIYSFEMTVGKLTEVLRGEAVATVNAFCVSDNRVYMAIFEPGQSHIDFMTINPSLGEKQIAQKRIEVGQVVMPVLKEIGYEDCLLTDIVKAGVELRALKTNLQECSFLRIDFPEEEEKSKTPSRRAQGLRVRSGGITQSGLR